jgi:hypothetical protein
VSSAVDVEAYGRVFRPAFSGVDSKIFRHPYVFYLQACLEHLIAIRGTRTYSAASISLTGVRLALLRRRSGRPRAIGSAAS